MAQSDRLKRINEERMAQGLTYRQLADMAQLSGSTVYRAVTGHTVPETYTIERMEAALGIPDLINCAPGCSGQPMDAAYKAEQESRITRMRAHYNAAMAIQQRWLAALFAVNTALVLMVGSAMAYDMTHKDRGWIRD